MMTEKLRRFFLSNTGLWVIFIVWALFISNLWLPRNWDFYGTDDWDLTYSTFEVARKSIVEYGQWPSFNPYCSFGSDLDANPQATHVSIFFIPILIFGTFYGYKLSILLAILLGCWGAFKLFRSLQPDNVISVCMAMIFVGCAYFSRHVFQAGHSNTLYFYLMPWLAHFLNRFRYKKRFSDFLWPLLILFQTIVGGSPFVFIVFSLFIMLWGIGLVWIEKNDFKILLTFIWMLLLAIGLSAWKVWPVMQHWEYMPRLVKDESGINLLVWLQALCDFETDTRTHHKWHEFAMGLSLVLVAITIYQFRHIQNGKKWLILFLFIFWLSFGNMPPYANPWYLLNNFAPIFTSLRAPYRFGILVVFIICITSVKLFKYFNDKQLLYIILFAITLTQTLSFNSISKRITGSPRLESFKMEKATQPQPMRMTLQEEFFQYIYIKQNRLVENGYEPLTLSKVSDSMNHFIEGGKLVKFTPHRFKIQALEKDVSVCIRYSDNWHLKGQGRLMETNGLLHIIDSHGDAELYYLNPDVRNGLYMSGIALILAIGSCFFIFRKKKSDQQI
jgi:hypothetical protein